MTETLENVEQAENTKVESTENNQEQTESVSIADKNEFLQNFIKDIALKGRNKINRKRSSKKHDLSGYRMSKLQLIRMKGLTVYPTVIRII